MLTRNFLLQNSLCPANFNAQNTALPQNVCNKSDPEQLSKSEKFSNEEHYALKNILSSEASFSWTNSSAICIDSSSNMKSA